MLISSCKYFSFEVWKISNQESTYEQKPLDSFDNGFKFPVNLQKCFLRCNWFYPFFEHLNSKDEKSKTRLHSLSRSAVAYAINGKKQLLLSWDSPAIFLWKKCDIQERIFTDLETL